MDYQCDGEVEGGFISSQPNCIPTTPTYMKILVARTYPEADPSAPF